MVTGVQTCALPIWSVRDTATTEIYTWYDTLSLHDSLPIYAGHLAVAVALTYALGFERAVRGAPAGDRVFAATVNGNGQLRFRATGVGQQTVLAGIIRLVEEAQGQPRLLEGGTRPHPGQKIGRASCRERVSYHV